MARHSKPLNTMITGEMAEAQQGVAPLKEEDEDTVARFAEWAYKGYYTAADPEIEASSPLLSLSPNIADPPSALEEVSDEQIIEPVAQNDEWFRSPPAPFKRSKKAIKSEELKVSRKTALKASFIRREYSVRQEAIDIPSTRANQGENENYTKVFLSHAYLYIFADKWDIPLLQKLALEELHHTLADYTLYRRRTGDIIALLRYGYENPVAAAEGGDDLQTMLSSYIAYEMDVLMKDDEFYKLMIDNGGPLLRDFMRMVAKRLE